MPVGRDAFAVSPPAKPVVGRFAKRSARHRAVLRQAERSRPFPTVPVLSGLRLLASNSTAYPAVVSLFTITSADTPGPPPPSPRQGESMTDTIAAVATPAGTGGVGVIRVSGPLSPGILSEIFRPKPAGAPPAPRLMRYGHVLDASGGVIDEVLAVYMPAPHSYTAEDVAEIHCHGGVVVTEAVLRRVLECGARIAEPGEFTRRAFLNGRIDLTRAEAVIDVINSRTDMARRAAVNRLKGGLFERINAQRRRLLDLIADIEVSIDYPEHDMETQNLRSAAETAGEILAGLRALLAGFETGSALQNGVNAVIAGKPNVGKSSLMNALLMSDRAIITDTAGTTRDVLRERVSLGNIPLNLSDTAGIRPAEELENAAERIGVEKAGDEIRQADIVLLVLDASRPPDAVDLRLLADTAGKRRLILLNKSDLPRAAGIDDTVTAYHIEPENVISVCARTGEGLDALRGRLERLFLQGRLPQNEELFVSNLRHKNLLEQAAAALERALAAIAAGLPEDFVSQDLQAAFRRLGEIIGEDVSDAISDAIFSRFCLGK